MVCRLLLLLVLVASQANAQIRHFTATDVVAKPSFACNFFDHQTQFSPVAAVTVPDKEATAWMKGMVNRIMKIVGLQNRFQLVALQNYNNCSAVCYNNDIGQDRYIQFDRAFLERYERETNNRWFSIGVLAHEIGHHLNGHSLDGVGSRPNKELEADEFAGYILQKLGASAEAARGIFSYMTETEGPPTHPVKSKRKEAITRGWDNAANKITLATLSFNDADLKQFAFQHLQEARKLIDPSARLRLINLALEEVPDYAEALSEKGLALMDANNLTAAKNYCTRAVMLEPYIGLLRLNLAKVYVKLQHADTAYLCINDAIYLKPVFPEAYHIRASLQFDAKAYLQCISDCTLGLALSPDTDFLKAALLETKGMGLYELGELNLAEECFAAAAKLNPYSLRVGIFKASKKKQ